MIRSKVACIRAAQGDPGAGERARALLDAGTASTCGAPAVRVVLVGGSPGTGKSTLAVRLGEQLGWTVLRSDAVRKDITGVGRATSAAAPFGEGIYDTTTTRATYQVLLERVLAKRWSSVSR